MTTVPAVAILTGANQIRSETMFGHGKCPNCKQPVANPSMDQITVGDGFAGPKFNAVAICCANPQCQIVLSIVADPSSLAADIAHRVGREIRGAKG